MENQRSGDDASHGNHQTTEQSRQQFAGCFQLPYIKQETPDNYNIDRQHATINICADGSLSTRIKEEIDSTPDAEYKLKQEQRWLFKPPTNMNIEHVKVESVRYKSEIGGSSVEFTSPGCSTWSNQMKHELDHVAATSRGSKLTSDMEKSEVVEPEVNIIEHDSSTSEMRFDCHENGANNFAYYPIFNAEGGGDVGSQQARQNHVQFAADNPNNSDKTYTCPYCSFTVKYKSSLNIHIKVKHDPNAEVYKCAECDYASKRMGNLLQHVRGQHDASAEVHKCSECNYTTKHKSNLFKHARVKHDPNADVYKCAECDYTSKRMDIFVQHVRIRHDADVEIHRCPQCDYTTKWKNELVRHLRVKHDPNAEVYKCSECRYTTKQIYYLIQHVRGQHNKDGEMHRCTECSYTNKLKKNLIRHVRVHHSGEATDYKCECCDYVTKYKSNLSNHLRRKHS